MHVRCLKLIKPYRGKFTTAADEWKDDEDNEEDDDDDDEDSDRRRALPPVGRIMEQDILSQAYKLGAFHQGRARALLLPLYSGYIFLDAVASYGTKGIPQSGIASRMNVGKLEARMLWRKLERDGVIKVRHF